MKNNVETLVEAHVKNEQTLIGVAARGVKVNKGLRSLLARKTQSAGMDFLQSIHTELLAADPYFGLDPLEKIVAIKRKEREEMNKFDTSPCPLSERVQDHSETVEGFVDMLRNKGTADWLALLNIEN